MSDTAASSLAKKANISHQLTLGFLITLLLLFAAWYLVLLPPPKAAPWLIALFHIIPLALFLPGILKRKPRTYIWLCFFILLYFCEGVLSAFLLPSLQGWLGLAETLLTTATFIAAMFAARWNHRVQHQ